MKCFDQREADIIKLHFDLHKDELLKLPRVEVAKKLQEMCKFTVTEGNVIGMEKRFQVKFPRKPRTVQAPEQIQPPLPLENDMKEDFKILLREVRIHRDLLIARKMFENEPYSPALANLINKYGE
jgi:hypothetical protein